MRISVFGTGYVGTVVAVALAETGNDVMCVDTDEKRLTMLREGRLPFHEPGVLEYLQRNIREGRLTFTSSAEEGVRYGEVLFVAVGTPQGDDGLTDLGALKEVFRSIGRFANSRKVVAIKSTVPVGTAREMKKMLEEMRKDVEFSVVSNPEFMKEGAALADFTKPARVVIGTTDEYARQIMTELYEPFMRVSKRVFFCNNETAEMIKYASNAFLATKISFINEIANICERVGADVNQVRLAVGADPRIGAQFLFPGVGFGGSCLPKDLNSLIAQAKKAGYTPSLLDSVRSVNEKQWKWLVAKIEAHFKGNLKGLKSALWGLSFKPETDDIRESPALKIATALLEKGVKISAYDPVAIPNAKKVLGDSVEYGKGMYDVLEGADMLVVVTEWLEFRHPDFGRMHSLMRQPV
ncbi:MAG: UDP-glucose/GDP-mannose dehydrogenase family protein, partial [Planctomycetota bacterium]|nr:UDP-glucose/GDP-mannose dehydrogenase family protein [Planctomycetota bacterium]